MLEQKFAHLTHEEFSKYAIHNEIIQKRFEVVVDERLDFKNEMEKLELQNEVLREQIYFAQRLINKIEDELVKQPNKKHLVCAIKNLLSDTFFER
jgi:hypothetical protein